MPAKPLTPEQIADAARLKSAFKEWQQGRKAAKLPSTQDEVAEQHFGFGQSALSQYLNGTIPLNAEALQKFCAVFGVSPDSISPSIVRAAQEKGAALLAGFGAMASPIRESTAVVKVFPAAVDHPMIDAPGLRKTRAQKSRDRVPTVKAKRSK